jgi:hypothetical protein
MLKPLTKFHLALAILLACADMHAGAQNATAGSLSFSVVYSDTGKAASGINLWVEPEEQPTFPHPDPQTGEYELRDADQRLQRFLAKPTEGGLYVATDLPPGTYIVHTYAPPYLSPDDTIYPTSNTAHVSTGPRVSPHALRARVTAGQTQRLTVRLQRGGAVEGTVQEAKGNAAVPETAPSGVAVSAERKLGPDSYARTGGTAPTDGNGHYRLEGLAPGDYIVFAGRGGPMVPTATGLIGSSALPIYAPGTVRPDQATVVHIAGAETVRADFMMPPQAALHRIDGTVAVEGQEALQHLTVRLYPKDEGGLTAATPLKADRGFSFDSVPDGEYTISIEFHAQSEVVSVDREHGIVRMRMRPAPYGTTIQNVKVAGQNVAGILLRPPTTAPYTGGH